MSLPAAHVKAEIIEPVDLEMRILELCQGFPNGLPDSELETMLPNIDRQQRVAAVNALLTKAKIDLLKSGSSLLYKLKTAEDITKFQGADKEDRLLYQIIQEAGNKGIWIRDIRIKSNLGPAQCTKILRNLETKKLIKTVKTIGASERKKLYMLFEVQPDSSLTGGTFYTDKEFDSEFVGLISEQACKYLQLKQHKASEISKEPLARRRASLVPATEILDHIKQLRISNVDLELPDVAKVLNTLVWDGRAEKVAGTHGTWLYRAVNPRLPPAGLMRIPCSVFNDCFPGRVISPATCKYFDDWLVQQ